VSKESQTGLIRTLGRAVVTAVHDWSSDRVKDYRIAPVHSNISGGDHGAPHPSNFIAEKQAERVDAPICTAVARLSDAIKKTPLELIEVNRLPDGRVEEFKDFNHPAYTIWQRPLPPNAKISSLNLMEAFVQSLITVGNSYNSLEFSGFEPNEIWPVPPDNMRLIPDGNGLVKRYEYRYGTESVKFKPEEIIHIKLFNINDLYYGQSRLKPALMEIMTNYYAKKWNLNFFKNYAIPPGFISPKEHIDEDDQKNIKKQWNELYAGMNNWHRIGVMPAEFEFKKIMQDVKDIQFGEMLGFNRETIYGIQGLPPLYAGILKYANYANSKTQEKLFWTIAVTPLLMIIEDALNNQMLWLHYDEERRFRYKFNLDNVEALQVDRLDRAKVKTLSLKWRPANEIRADEGLGPLDGEDVIQRSSFGGLGATPVGTDPTPQKTPRMPLTFKMSTDEAMNIMVAKSWASAQDRLMTSAENGMTTHMSQFFKGQLRRVLDNLKKATKGLRTPLFWAIKADDMSADAALYFNVDSENALLRDNTRKYYQTVVKDSGQAALDAAHKIGASFDVFDPRVTVEIEKLLNPLDYVNKYTWKEIQSTLRTGYEEGSSISQIEKEIRGLFYDMTKGRSTLIARTEMTGVVNGGTHQAYYQADIDYIKWLAFMDSKTRPDHQYVHMEKINIAAGERFAVGRDMMRYPGDPEASVGNRANCRCTTIGVIDIEE
jgi:HK97 family phage portal protein